MNFHKQKNYEVNNKTIYKLKYNKNTQKQKTNDKHNKAINKSLHMLRLFIFSMAQQPQVRQSLLIIGVSRSHSDTLQSVGFLWTSDQPDAEIST